MSAQEEQKQEKERLLAEAKRDAAAREIDNVQRALGEGAPRRVIYVPGRLLNFVL